MRREANSLYPRLISTAISLNPLILTCFLSPFFQVIVLSSALLTPRSTIELLFATDRLQPDTDIWQGRICGEDEWVPQLETSNPWSVALPNSLPKNYTSPAAVMAPAETGRSSWLSGCKGTHAAHRQLFKTVWLSSNNSPLLNGNTVPCWTTPVPLCVARVIACHNFLEKEQLRTRWCWICTLQAVRFSLTFSLGFLMVGNAAEGVKG